MPCSWADAVRGRGLTPTREPAEQMAVATLPPGDVNVLPKLSGHRSRGGLFHGSPSSIRAQPAPPRASRCINSAVSSSWWDRPRVANWSAISLPELAE
jgi:hypothetical protein